MDWIGSILGLMGAFTLALNSRWSYLGWWLFLGSNVAWITFSLTTNTYSLLAMQIGFTVTSILGIYRSKNKIIYRKFTDG